MSGLLVMSGRASDLKMLLCYGKCEKFIVIGHFLNRHNSPCEKFIVIGHFLNQHDSPCEKCVVIGHFLYKILIKLRSKHWPQVRWKSNGTRYRRSMVNINLKKVTLLHVIL